MVLWDDINYFDVNKLKVIIKNKYMVENNENQIVII